MDINKLKQMIEQRDRHIKELYPQMVVELATMRGLGKYLTYQSMEALSQCITTVDKSVMLDVLLTFERIMAHTGRNHEQI